MDGPSTGVSVGAGRVDAATPGAALVGAVVGDAVRPVAGSASGVDQAAGVAVAPSVSCSTDTDRNRVSAVAKSPSGESATASARVVSAAVLPRPAGTVRRTTWPILGALGRRSLRHGVRRKIGR